MRYDDDPRIRELEEAVVELAERVARLEGAPRRPAPARPVAWEHPAAPAHPPAPPAPPPPDAPPAPPSGGALPSLPRPSLDLEDLLGGRVLAWAGAVAVVVGLVLFLGTAISRGWIDETTRVALAYLGSTLLLAAGLFLEERRGRTQAARAAVAAAIVGLFASTLAATSLYALVDPAVGLAVGLLVGAAAAAIAVRWQSVEMAGIGIVGALLSPVLVGADTGHVTLAFMAVALVASTAVLLWQRWDGLAIAAFLTSAPQLVGWLNDNYEARTALALLVLAAFWLVYAVAAVGYELRVPTGPLRLTSGSLLLGDALLLAGAGWAILADTGRSDSATAWVIAVAVVHVALGTATLRGRISREISLLLLAVGTGLSAIGAALALDGPALVAAWSVEAVVLAWLARRTATQRGFLAAAGFLVAAAVHAVLIDADADALTGPFEAEAVVAVLLVAAAALLFARLYAGPMRELPVGAEALGLAAIVYAVPVAFDGVVVTVAWAALAVAFLLLSSRSLVRDDGLAAPVALALATVHALVFEAPPDALRTGVDDLDTAVLALAALVAAAAVGARVATEPVRRSFEVAVAVGAVYLPSVVIVDLTADSAGGGQTPQVLLSSFWAACGLAALVVGLVREARRLRVAGLVLLGIAATKVVVYDLAELDEIYRVLSFVALGLLLLAGGYAYQRMRRVDEGAP